MSKPFCYLINYYASAGYMCQRKGTNEAKTFVTQLRVKD